jgi:hypothetical protein
VDRRIEGLLDLKQLHSCTPDAALQLPDTDLALWSSFRQWLANQPPSPALDMASRDRRTAVFDSLGPKPVSMPIPAAGDAGIAGQTIANSWKDLAWYPGVDALGSFKVIGTLKERAQRGILMLTDDALVAQIGAPGVDIKKDPTHTDMTVRYQDIVAITNSHFGFNRDVVIHYADGHVDSLQIAQGESVQIHLTVSIGEELRSRVSAWHRQHDAPPPDRPPPAAGTGS